MELLNNNDKKLFTIKDIENAWRSGNNNEHPTWSSFKLKLIKDKMTETLTGVLDKLK
jgi:hypothetical protein